MDDKNISQLEELAKSGDVEAIFQLGLLSWENFGADLNFKNAKNYIGEAKRRGHSLADMYWDIICAFEDASIEERDSLDSK